jgi:TPR repeat protein
MRCGVVVASGHRWCHGAAAVAVAATLLLLPGRLPAADFAAGLAAYDAGNLAQAYAEWRPLAEAGDIQAQVALAGLLTAGGPGLARDLAAAVRWYRRAARRGDPVAQMNLGEMYARGAGVARDRVWALAWFDLAAAQGRTWAARQRDRLAAELTPDERAAARRLADELRQAP